MGEALYAIIGVLIIRIYKSYVHALKWAQVDHFHSCGLKLRALAESGMTVLCKPFAQQRVREIVDRNGKIFLYEAQYLHT